MRPQTNTTSNRFPQRMLWPTQRGDESSQGGSQNQMAPQDRFLPIIMNLEQANLLDEPTSTLLRTLILDENLEIFRILNNYCARVINEQQLC